MAFMRRHGKAMPKGNHAAFPSSAQFLINDFFAVLFVA